MIIEMPNTRTREISQKIDELHEERGESATGRVLTLLISTTEDELEQALELANAASREHPCRVIAISPAAWKWRAQARRGCAQARRGRGCGVRQFQSGRPGALRRGRRCR